MQRFRIAIAACSAVLAGSIDSHADIVQRRGDQDVLRGEVTRLDDAGLTLRNMVGVDLRIPWDRVRVVEMEKPDRKLPEYLETSMQLWRARTRLERHDAAMAEPLLERLFEKYRGQTHETALLVAEGLARCRLLRGAHEAALIPALEAARLRRAVPDSHVYSSLPAIFDETTSLCMALAPAWVTSGSLAKLERDLGSYNAQADTVIAAQASLYRRAVAQQLDIRLDPKEAVLAAEHPGVARLLQFVDVSSKDAARRNSAREALLRDLPSLPTWAQAWAYYTVGSSLLSESGEGRREQGMVLLAHLPSHFGGLQPYLTGLALAKMIAACEASGHAAAASSLRAEFAARFPQHPALAALAPSPGPPASASSSVTKE